MSQIELMVNGETYLLDIEADTPLLWVLRDFLGLTGTKYSCGIGMCGGCTVLVDNDAQRSCRLPVSEAVGKQITTIEGLSQDGSHPLQQAWLAEQVAQCGYCQPGQIMAAAALLRRNPHPSEAEIQEAMDGVLCRCGTYPRILKAITRAAQEGAA
jgi:isoquinoline 1-oxidoreductase alpha subunit